MPEWVPSFLVYLSAGLAVVCGVPLVVAAVRFLKYGRPDFATRPFLAVPLAGYPIAALIGLSAGTTAGDVAVAAAAVGFAAAVALWMVTNTKDSR